MKFTVNEFSMSSSNYEEIKAKDTIPSKQSVVFHRELYQMDYNISNLAHLLPKSLVTQNNVHRE